MRVAARSPLVAVAVALVLLAIFSLPAPAASGDDNQPNVAMVRNVVAPDITLLSSFGAQGSGDGYFSGALGVAVDPVSGAVYVVDSGHSRVEKFDANGHYLGQFGGTDLVQPWYAAVDPATGDVYVSDTSQTRVVKYDSDGNYLLAFGSNGTGDGRFGDPLGVAVDPRNGDVYVVDATNGRVERFSSGGSYLSQFGAQADPFGSPYDVAVDSTGTVYVTDVRNGPTGNWVARFDSGGGYLGSFGTTGAGDGQFQLPFGIGIDSPRSIAYVDDFWHGRMEMFDTAGTYLGTFGSGLSESRGVAIDTETGDVYVTVGSTVEKFGPVRNWTQTSLSCSPHAVAIGQATTCTATVADTTGGGQTTPEGTVSFSARTSGSAFSDSGSCALTPTATAYHASCSVTYTPGQIGSGTHWIYGSYRGSTSHVGSGVESPAVTVNPAEAPTITSFTPTSGGRGTSVTIAGTNFTGATAVTFNGTAAQSYNVDTDTQITAVVAVGTTSGPIAVTTSVGTATSSGSFTFFAAPTISSFNPISGGVHRTVTVAGTNLTGTTSVRLHGVSAAFSVVSATHLTFTVPAGATSDTIAVTAPGGMATSIATFTVSLPPTITGVSPGNGPVGTTVTITGTNLGGTIGVRIGSIITVPTSVSDNQVVFTIPPGAVDGQVRILSPAGSATSPGVFDVSP